MKDKDKDPGIAPQVHDKCGDVVRCNHDDTSKYGSLKNDLMQAMYRFKSVGRRGHGFGLGAVHSNEIGPNDKDSCDKNMHGVFDINPGEMFFMEEILARKLSGDNSGNWLSSMSDYLHVSKAAVSQMLGTLEKKGFITRETNPDNRREIRVSLTEEGEKRVNEMQRLFSERTDILIERFGVEDTKELIRLVDKLTDILGGGKE